MTRIKMMASGTVASTTEVAGGLTLVVSRVLLSWMGTKNTSPGQKLNEAHILWHTPKWRSDHTRGLNGVMAAYATKPWNVNKQVTVSFQDGGLLFLLKAYVCALSMMVQIVVCVGNKCTINNAINTTSFVCGNWSKQKLLSIKLFFSRYEIKVSKIDLDR